MAPHDGSRRHRFLPTPPGSPAVTRSATRQARLPEQARRRLREGWGIALMALAVLLFIALFTYFRNDPGWSHVGPPGGSVVNAGGFFGAWVADVLFVCFGYVAYLLPLAWFWRGVLVFRHPLVVDDSTPAQRWLRRGAWVAFVLSACALLSIHFTVPKSGVAGLAETLQEVLPETAGGVLGATLGRAALTAFNLAGSTLLLLAVLLAAFRVVVDVPWLRIAEWTGARTLALVDRIAAAFEQRRQEARVEREAEVLVEKREEAFREHQAKVENRKPPEIAEVAPPPKPSVRVQKEKQRNLFETEVSGELPPLSLLDSVDKAAKKGYSREALESMSRLLELKLRDFGIEAEVTGVLPGPVITRFEIQPAAGVKVSRITNLAKDLARSLAVVSVRVVEVIPGKTVVGIEIPNEKREMIRLSEVVASSAFDEAQSPLTLALGKDIAGNPVVVDLAKMPHLLVAGTTGSGKSVGLNAMLLSLMYKSTPEHVRLIMIDPKMLELAVYDNIPHLLTPVVTDMKEAASALRWGVAEMERRYRLMAQLGVRNLGGFNKKVQDAKKAGEPIRDPLWKPQDSVTDTQAPELTTLPYVVIVVDEFADMMMIVGKKVEELIARIAQKARAAGIHLILATQRPSVDVITGLIKANVPSRISFQVSSRIDSRTVIDQGGAEQLLGHGDMLYLPVGTSVPERVHGAFVADEEVHRVCDDWRRRGAPNYIEEITRQADEGGGGGFGGGGDGEEGGDPESDPLYDQAVAFVIESGRVSISSVQRKLKIGYNRAARLVEAMENAGLVSAMQPNGQREVIRPGS
ncbi:MAG: DNA translocase FtsK [Pseudomonadota bacterium]